MPEIANIRNQAVLHARRAEIDDSQTLPWSFHMPRLLLPLT